MSRKRSEPSTRTPNRFGRHTVGRGDLARLFYLDATAGGKAPDEKAAGAEGVDRDALAELAGFERSAAAAAPRPAPPLAATAGVPVAFSGAEVPAAAEPPLQRAVLPLLCAVGLEVREPDPREERVPEWLGATVAASDEDVRARRLVSLEPPSLIPRSRLGVVLRRWLERRRASARLDEPRLVRELARCRVLTRVPRRARRSWAPRLQLYWDQAALMQPCFHDQLEVAQWLRRFRGEQGLEELVVEPGGEVVWVRRAGPHRLPRLARPRPPDAGTTVLALGDLGFAHADAERQALWRRFARHAARSGAARHALVLCPKQRFEPELARLWNAREWERARPLQTGAVRLERHARPAREASAVETAREELLTLLSPAVRIEPALLRAVRQLLPRARASVATELDAFTDERVRGRSILGMTLGYEAAKELRKVFLREPAARRHQVKHLLERYHQDLDPIVLAEELFACGEPSAPARSEQGPDASALEAAERRFAGRVRRWFERGVDGEAARAYVERWQARQGASAWNTERLAAFWAVAHRTRDGFDAPLPEGLDVERVLWVFRGLPEPGWCRLWQRGPRLQILSIDEPSDALPGAPGSRIAELPLRLREVEFTWHTANGRPHAERLRLGQSLELPFSARSEIERILVTTDLARLTLLLEPLPPWASELGRDAYGLFAKLELTPDIAIVLRFIPPGSFMMGSPEDEAGRYGNESPQHRVTLTQGFWLAETPCTQAEWQAVMGSNPSRFEGDPRCPVERVSWKDCEAFCRELDARFPGLASRLPTEAEWEYACRAGTRSAFNDGSPCTKPSGRDPALMRLGWFGENSRGATEAVKQLKPNSWGLYDMHGNVWERCEDWFGQCEAGEQVDPRGPPSGSKRVYRGGSWFDSARHCRSASRSRRHPSALFYLLGFRLARGQPGVSPASMPVIVDAGLALEFDVALPGDGLRTRGAEPHEKDAAGEQARRSRAASRGGAAGEKRKGRRR